MDINGIHESHDSLKYVLILNAKARIGIEKGEKRKMPKGYKKDGGYSGKIFQKGISRISWNKGKGGYKLKPFSLKHIERLSLAHEGQIPWNKDVHMWTNREHPRGMLGKTAWNKDKKGIHLSPKTEFTSEKAKVMWQNPEYRNKIIRNTMKAQNKKPNKKEHQLNELLQKYFPNEFKYTGDGVNIIYGLCPDFTNCNSKKKLIELFGDYWHNDKQRNIKWICTEWGRKAIYSQLGYDCLIIWEHELKDENKVVKKIKNFVGG